METFVVILEDGPTMVLPHITVEDTLAALGHCLPLRVGHIRHVPHNEEAGQIRPVPHNEELALAGLRRARKMPCPC